MTTDIYTHTSAVSNQAKELLWLDSYCKDHTSAQRYSGLNGTSRYVDGLAFHDSARIAASAGGGPP